MRKNVQDVLIDGAQGRLDYVVLLVVGEVIIFLVEQILHCTVFLGEGQYTGVFVMLFLCCSGNHFVFGCHRVVDVLVSHDGGSKDLADFRFIYAGYLVKHLCNGYLGRV
jgi:hypothetical protein